MTIGARRAWLRSGAAMLVVACAVPVGGVAAASLPDGVARAAARWLGEQQHLSGAFGGETQPADQVADALASLAVAGIDGTIRARGLELIRRDGPARAQEQAAYAARITLGLVAVGEDPRAFGGFDYVAAIHARYNELLGTHGGNLYAEALAGLGRIAAGETLPAAYLDRLQDGQCAGGGYAYSDRCGRPPDADTTSLVLSVVSLAGASNDAPAIAESLTWLRDLQAVSGAFPLEDGFDANANSTGLVITMLRTLGIDPASWRRDTDPVTALTAFAVEDGGLAFTRGGAANLSATVQGIPGLLRASFPLRAREPVMPTAQGSTPAAQPTSVTHPGTAQPSNGSSPAPVPQPTLASTSTAPTVIAADGEPVSGTSPRRPGTGMLLWGPALLLLFFVGAFVVLRRRDR